MRSLVRKMVNKHGEPELAERGGGPGGGVMENGWLGENGGLIN